MSAQHRNLSGFAAMSPEERKAISARGGRRAHELGRAYEYTTEKAILAGTKGGVSLVAKRGVEYMREIGRKGGQAISKGNSQHMRDIGRMGGRVRNKDSDGA